MPNRFSCYICARPALFTIRASGTKSSVVAVCTECLEDGKVEITSAYPDAEIIVEKIP